MTLGEKIKKIRKEQYLTQASLAENIITRNMLSAIEKGTATPSLSTIQALAQRLSVPVAYFLSEEEDLFPFLKAQWMPHLRDAFVKGNYKECIQKFERSRLRTDDELALMLAECHFCEAERNFHNGSFRSAKEHLIKLEQYCELTAYGTSHFKAGATVLSAILTNVQSPRYEFDADAYQRHIRRAVLSDLHAYLLNDTTHTFSSPLLLKHLEAHAMLKEHRYSTALPILLELEMGKGNTEISAFFLFRLYADLEKTYRELGDYENAYKYSSKRLSQLSAFLT